MYFRIITKALLMIFLSAIQISFVSGLPSHLSGLNVILVISIMILGFVDFKTALLWAVITGFIWDVYSFLLFGTNTIALIASLLLADFLLENFLTNRSLYSFLAITFSTFVLFDVIIYSTSFLHSVMFSGVGGITMSISFFKNELMVIFFNLLLTLLLFYVINFFSKRFKPMFLIK